MLLVGLGYKARSGKDTVASHLVNHHGFQKIAFADALKDAARCIFSLTQEQMYGDDKERLDPFWQDTPRNILQKLGTECLRRGYRDDVWIKAAFRKMQQVGGDRWVITDVRFPNEAYAVMKAGGYLVRVDRDEALRAQIGTTSHASETALDVFVRWDDVIQNNGTLNQLRYSVDSMMRGLECLA